MAKSKKGRSPDMIRGLVADTRSPQQHRGIDTRRSFEKKSEFDREEQDENVSRKLERQSKRLVGSDTIDLSTSVQVAFGRIEEAKKRVLNLAKNYPSIKNDKDFPELKQLVVDLADIKEILSTQDLKTINDKLLRLFALIGFVSKRHGRRNRGNPEVARVSRSSMTEEVEMPVVSRSSPQHKKSQVRGNTGPLGEEVVNKGTVVFNRKEEPGTLDDDTELLKNNIEEKTKILRSVYKEVNGLLLKKGKITQADWRESLDTINNEIKELENFSSWHRSSRISDLSQKIEDLLLELQRIKTQLV